MCPNPIESVGTFLKYGRVVWVFPVYNWHFTINGVTFFYSILSMAKCPVTGRWTLVFLTLSISLDHALVNLATFNRIRGNIYQIRG